VTEQEKSFLYVTIHGHFYQPPREDPWTEIVERQKGTASYHDWNELITYHCYLPNGCARVVDGKGRIVDIVNNYSYMSFNFGPTLFSWMERKFPWVAHSIVEADRQSAKRNKGHGNAIAQTYSHMIMPLANEKDKRTQAKWGISYFEKKFGRYPEAIWLPETAVNYPTVRVLLDFGIKFIILAPHQAQRVRPLQRDEDSWVDVSDGSIDTKNPYRLFLKDEKGKRIQDKFLDVFFYHEGLSRAVAFEKVLKSSRGCADRIEKIFRETKEEKSPWLVNIATDGETYGYHDPFGDMCLAHLVKYELPKRGIQLVNYPHYLEIHPPSQEVEIKEGKNGEGTSWSCAHGVDRWKKDCGCSTGANPEWNQKWRAPLRNSLDWLRDRLSEVFEREGQDLFKEPWQARDDYIEVVMERSGDNVTRFMQSHLQVEDAATSRVRALKLLEMQRFAMLMYTSCGWFFDELSGLETVQNLKCALRAIQLAKEVADEDLEEEFVNRLGEAKSNLREFGDGREVYQKLVRPSLVDWPRALAHFLMSQCSGAVAIGSYPYHLEISEVKERKTAGVLLKVGKGELRSKITEEVNQGVFLLVYLGEQRIHCFIAETLNDKEYCDLQERVLSDDADFNPEGIRNIASPFFGRSYTLRDLFPEDKEEIFSCIIKDGLEEIREANESLFARNVDTIRDLGRMGWQMSPDLTFLTGNVLNSRVRKQVEEFGEDGNSNYLGKVQSVKLMADELGLNLDTSLVAKMVEKIIPDKIKALSQGFDIEAVERLRGLNQYIASLKVDYRRDEAQNELWEILQQKIIPQFDKLLENEQDLRFVDHFLFLAEEFNLNTDSLRERIMIKRSKTG